MKQILWWLCLLVAPLVLIGLELFHPASFTAHPGMYQFLSHYLGPGHDALGYFGPTWWFVLHMIQTPTVGLVAVGLWLMVDDVALSLRLSRRVGWGPAALMIAFGWMLQTAHASPHGPIAFSLLIVAAAWTWWSRRHEA